MALTQAEQDACVDILAAGGTLTCAIMAITLSRQIVGLTLDVAGKTVLSAQADVYAHFADQKSTWPVKVGVGITPEPVI